MLLAHELAHVVQQSENVPSPGVLQRRTSPAPSAVTIDDAVVQKYIDGALKSHSNKVYAAAEFLNLEREKAENHGNESMAAAEHYLYARWIGSLGLNATTPILLYQLGKMLRIRIPLGSGPVTPSSLGQLRWEMLGAKDGYREFGGSLVDAMAVAGSIAL